MATVTYKKEVNDETLTKILDKESKLIPVVEADGWVAEKPKKKAAK